MLDHCLADLLLYILYSLYLRASLVLGEEFSPASESRLPSRAVSIKSGKISVKIQRESLTTFLNTLPWRAKDFATPPPPVEFILGFFF